MLGGIEGTKHDVDRRLEKLAALDQSDAAPGSFARKDRGERQRRRAVDNGGVVAGNGKRADAEEAAATKTGRAPD